VKIWFQNRRTKWKKQDNISNSEVGEHKTTNPSKNAPENNGKTQSSTASTSSSATAATTAMETFGKKSQHHHNNNTNNSASNIGGSNEKHRTTATTELSAKLTAKQATKIKKQLNALLEKTAKNSTAASVNSNSAALVNGGGGDSVTTPKTAGTSGKSSNKNVENAQQHPHNHQQQQQHNHHPHHHHRVGHHSHSHALHRQHAIPLTVEPAAPLEQTEKLEIKLEESPQHRELQLSLLRAASNHSPLHFSDMDFESKLAASKISNALLSAKLNVDRTDAAGRRNGSSLEKELQKATSTAAKTSEENQLKVEKESGADMAKEEMVMEQETDVKSPIIDEHDYEEHEEDKDAEMRDVEN
ncbi:PREDICTED: MOB kinase activator-like 2, partial [Rhagoletis zephyria]|uniref:MOB kinase activator-like 2 n=1 Tax=Rhagoletis zephyria TaxID=28612 RepID=UPI000811A8A3